MRALPYKITELNFFWRFHSDHHSILCTCYFMACRIQCRTFWYITSRVRVVWCHDRTNTIPIILLLNSVLNSLIRVNRILLSFWFRIRLLWLCLKETFSEIFQLRSLMLTIPASSSSVERSFSALKTIKTYSRNKMLEDRLSDLAIISIDKCLLKELKIKRMFYEDVINLFINKSYI